MKKTKTVIVFLLTVILFVCSGCNPVKNFFAFGTVINISLEKGKVNKTVSEINDRFDKLNNQFDTDNPTSDLGRLNSAKAGEKITVSNDTYNLLALSKDIYQKTDGAFNIATYPLSELWKLSPDTYSAYAVNFVPPSQQLIDNVLLNCNFDDIVLSENNVVIKNNSNIKISFGALAKGYAGDIAYKIAVDNKNEGFIDVGGTIFVCGDKNVNIGIGSPRENEFEYFGKVKLTGGSIICTSGDYYRYYMYEGKRYHHIFGIDGYPANSGVISATIVSTDNKASGALCDALSTAVVALGTEKGIELVNFYGLSAVIITDENSYYLVNLDENIFTLKDTSYTKNV